MALVGGIWPFAFALWSPGLAAPDSIEGLVRLHMLWWAGAAAAGALAVGGVILALWSRTAARLMVGLAGLILLGTLTAFTRIHWLPIVALLVPGLALLAAAPFVGPMPSPEEEGRRR